MTNILDATTPLTFLERIRQSYCTDKSIVAVIKALKNHNAPRIKNFTLAECAFSNDLLFYRDKIVVPQGEQDHSLILEIIQAHHDPPAAGHQGAAATYSVIARKFFCSRIKPHCEGAQGLLCPLPVANERWQIGRAHV